MIWIGHIQKLINWLRPRTAVKSFQKKDFLSSLWQKLGEIWQIFFSLIFLKKLAWTPLVSNSAYFFHFRPLWPFPIVFKFQFRCLFLVPSSYLNVLSESEFWRTTQSRSNSRERKSSRSVSEKTDSRSSRNMFIFFCQYYIQSLIVYRMPIIAFLYQQAKEFLTSVKSSTQIYFSIHQPTNYMNSNTYLLYIGSARNLCLHSYSLVILLFYSNNKMSFRGCKRHVISLAYTKRCETRRNWHRNVWYKWAILTSIMKFHYENHIYYQMKKLMVRKSSWIKHG